MEGYHAVDGKLKEVLHSRITYFITESLAVRMFKGITTYCVVLRLRVDIVHKWYRFFPPSLQPHSWGKETQRAQVEVIPYIMHFMYCIQEVKWWATLWLCWVSKYIDSGGNMLRICFTGAQNPFPKCGFVKYRKVKNKNQMFIQCSRQRKMYSTTLILYL